MISPVKLKQLAKLHGTPLFIVDHAELRKNFTQFKKYLPRVQPYYAMKSNPNPAIVRTLYKGGWPGSDFGCHGSANCADPWHSGLFRHSFSDLNCGR